MYLKWNLNDTVVLEIHVKIFFKTVVKVGETLSMIYVASIFYSLFPIFGIVIEKEKIFMSCD